MLCSLFLSMIYHAVYFQLWHVMQFISIYDISRSLFPVMTCYSVYSNLWHITQFISSYDMLLSLFQPMTHYAVYFQLWHITQFISSYDILRSLFPASCELLYVGISSYKILSSKFLYIHVALFSAMTYYTVLYCIYIYIYIYIYIVYLHLCHIAQLMSRKDKFSYRVLVISGIDVIL